MRRRGGVCISFRLLTLLVLFAVGCRRADRGDTYARGHLLKLAQLPAAAEARLYDAAIHAAFDVEPALVLVMHPRRLPRGAGYEGGDRVPEGLVRALRERGLVRGVCDPIRVSPSDTPRCKGPDAGYIVRASDVLRVARDTVELYFAAEKFGAGTGQKPEALRFEKIYEFVGRGMSWRLAREARAP